jgi:hypothetical protein
MKAIYAVAVLCAVGAASPGLAQTPNVMGTASLGYTHTSEKDVGEDEIALNNSLVTGRAGARFGGYVGLEGELSFGLSGNKDVFDFDGVTGSNTAKIKNGLAGFVLGAVPLSANANLLARIGYGRIKNELRVRGFAAAGFPDEDLDFKHNFVAYGVGGEFFFYRSTGIRGDFTIYDIKNDPETSQGNLHAFTISLVQRF